MSQSYAEIYEDVRDELDKFVNEVIWIEGDGGHVYYAKNNFQTQYQYKMIKNDDNDSIIPLFYFVNIHFTKADSNKPIRKSIYVDLVLSPIGWNSISQKMILPEMNGTTYGANKEGELVTKTIYIIDTEEQEDGTIEISDINNLFTTKDIHIFNG